MNIRFFGVVGIVCFVFAASVHAQMIFGKVTDAITKKAIQGATVTLVEASKSYPVDSTGSYKSDTLKPGPHTVRVEAPNYLKLTKKVILASPNEVGTFNLEYNAALYSIAANADTTEGAMSVKYSFPNHSNVEITVVDQSGKTIRKAFDRTKVTGIRTFSWDGKDNEGKKADAGRYTCRLVSGRLVTVRTLNWKGAR